MTEYLTSDELALRYRTVPGTVRYWRYLGKGPKGIKVGRRVLYALDEVERWEQEKAANDAAQRDLQGRGLSATP